MSNETEIREIEKTIEQRRREQAREEARRDEAKAQLKRLLKVASEEYGVKSLAELEAVAERLKKEADAAMDRLREKTRDL